MDPDVTMKALLDCCAVWDAATEAAKNGDPASKVAHEDVPNRMAELDYIIRNWVTRGGFKPTLGPDDAKLVFKFRPDMKSVVRVRRYWNENNA